MTKSVKELYWRTADGVDIKLADMTDQHIQNCIKMLQRFINNRPEEYAYGEPEGDMAQDAFNAGIRHNDQLEDNARKQIEVFNLILKERKRENGKKRITVITRAD